MSLKCNILLFVAILLGSCVPKENNNSVSRFLPGKRLAELKDKKLHEVSGLASSVNNPGLLWGHNDSGNGAEVFLIDQKCEIKNRYVLQGIDNRDWEDMAVGPGPDSAQSYIYVGDIGDNDGTDALKYIYRFVEPLQTSTDEKVTVAVFDTIIFRLPDSMEKDTESLFIDPATNDLYVVSKREQPVYVYQIKYPYNSGDTITANTVATLPLTQIVAADLSADGTELLMKDYAHIYYWNNNSGKAISDLLKDRPEEIPYIREPQGEAIAWARDNSGFYTLSEVNKDEKSFLYFYERK